MHFYKVGINNKYNTTIFISLVLMSSHDGTRMALRWHPVGTQLMRECTSSYISCVQANLMILPCK